MNKNWLFATSFEEALRLLEAINELSSYAKLKLADIEEDNAQENIGESRKIISEFLQRFQQVTESAESNEQQPILGTDPRSSELVRRFLAQKKSRSRPSGLYGQSFQRMTELLQSDKKQDLQDLIDCLGDLRELVEQHSHNDVNKLLGEF